MGYACAMIVHTQADQLLSQLLMETFDTLTSQYRHIRHLHEEVKCQKYYIISSPEPKAHGELIVYRSIRRPSVSPWVRA